MVTMSLIMLISIIIGTWRVCVCVLVVYVCVISPLTTPNTSPLTTPNTPWNIMRSVALVN